MGTVFCGGTAIRLTKSFRKTIMSIKAIVHGNIDDTLAARKLCGRISQASASDILHNWYANIRVKHTIIVIGREPCNLCKVVYGHVFLQMLFDIINTILNADAVVHGVPPPDRYQDYSRRNFVLLFHFCALLFEYRIYYESIYRMSDHLLSQSIYPGLSQVN